jgi:hypothetical protein
MKRALFLPILLIALPASAATYYASPTGSGTTCSQAVPCSLAQCVANIAASGDVCSVGNGVYTNPASMTASRSCGTGSLVCTIKATTSPTDITNSSTYGARIDLTSGTGDWLTVSGNNWVVDGFLVRMQAQRRFVKAIAATGFTFSNNRVEVKPGFGTEVLWTLGTDNVVVRKNWVHHYPGCINGGETYGSGPWGAGATAPACGSHSRCDFDTTNGDAFLFEGDGTTAATTGLTFEQNDYGHWQNPMRIHNFVNVTYSRNKCTNATNHGCVEADDVSGMMIENNIADIDTGTSCNDEILQSALFDTYCFSNVTMRNNTSVGHGIGWEQQLDSLEPNPGADRRCADGVLPEVGSDGTWYDTFRVYNNIVYDGKPSSGAAGIVLNTGQSNSSPSPCCFSDYNLIFLPSGGDVGIDGGTFYTTFAAWQAHGKDLNGRSVAPQFVSYCNTFGTAGCHDYRAASATAPQVNAGMGTASLPCPSVDYDGNPRNDGACDIGAFEFQGGTSPTPPATVTGVTRTDKK